MTKNEGHRLPAPDDVRKQILANRGAFGKYNIARLGELIRRLPEAQRTSFETVPVLLHVNVPDLPGFVDDPDVPHGIYRFSESGFWRIGKRSLGIEEKTIQRFLLKKYYVRGVYLVGSSGTQAQTDISDLNYWVLIDSKSVNESQRRLFCRKLDGIKAWAREKHHQELTFLVLGLDQMQQKDFSGREDPCIALPQGTLTKEEFYRTFMLIAGQIPFWAVLPVGLADGDYRQWVDVARRLSDEEFLPDDYVDLGNVASIDAQECPGALLAEICKVRRDPVKSLVRSSLAAHHCLFQQQEGLLCERVKQGFLAPTSEGASPDPAVYGFERAVRFYENIDDRDGLDLIRLCVYLRLAGYPCPRLIDENDAKRDLLMRFRRQWAWTTAQGDRIESYAGWTEAERLDLDNRILHRLWFLFNLLVRAVEEPKEAKRVDPAGLGALRARTEKRFADKPGKIPRASAYLRVRRDPFSVHVVLQKSVSGIDHWAAYDKPTPGTRIEATCLFADPCLPRVLGWIVLNGLFRPERTSVVLHSFPSPIAARRAEGFLKDIHQFFQVGAAADFTRSEPAWAKLLVVLDPGLGHGHAPAGLASVVFLVLNTWEEMFFLHLDLAHIENNLLRCYEIAKRVGQYLRETRAASFEYQIVHSRTAEDAQAAKNIREFIGSSRNGELGDPGR